MTNAIQHRGPDDEGVYLSPDRRLGLGFRRLAIVDLSAAGHQPMSNEDGTVWLVFNGEIYNHAEHRIALEAKGHVYKGRSDSEAIIHLYEEYGEECVHRLRGMFAFAVWDQRRRHLFLARDRIGIKPLYYAIRDGVFIFGSEIKALLAYPNMPRIVDAEALYHYMTFMIPPAPHTMFAGVRKLAPGCSLTIDAGGNIREWRYWDAIVAKPNFKVTDVECKQRVNQLLQDSVRMRMMSDVPMGVFLSGGLDSSLITALMSKLSSTPVNTFSIGFANHAHYNEMGYARCVARYFGTCHHELMISHKDALEYVPQLVHSQDEPIGDWVCIPLYFLSRLARDNNVAVVQVGEGADELFCGYPLYLASLAVQRLWPLIAQIPQGFWRIGGAAGARLRRAGLRFGRRIERVANLLRNADGRFWGGALAIGEAEKAYLLDTPFWRDRPIASSGTVLDGFYSSIARMKPEADALERMIYFELKQRLAELLLMRVDKITMSVSIEARVPYLDHQLVEYAMGIPAEVKIRGRRTKAVLKRAAAGQIPDHIIRRRKQGFSAPVAEWLCNELAGEVRDSLLDGDLVRREYLNPDFVAQMLAEHREGRGDRSVELWNLYNLEAWHRHWIN